MDFDDALLGINNSHRPTLCLATKIITYGLFKRGSFRENGGRHRQSGEDAGRMLNKDTATSLR